MHGIIKRLSLVLTVVVAILASITLSGHVNASPPSQDTGGLGAADVAVLLNTHNEWRNWYKVRLVTWDNNVARYAQDWANHLAQTGGLSHRPNNPYGENIFAGTIGFFNLASVVNTWGNEVYNYNFAANTCTAGKVCGHFTQIVWSKTVRLGCGKATDGGVAIIVCNYDPPGNFIGQSPGAIPPPTSANPSSVDTAPTEVAATDTAPLETTPTDSSPTLPADGEEPTDILLETPVSSTVTPQ